MERTKHGEFNWVDVAARDFEGQTSFYEALFGWDHTDLPMEGTIYRLLKARGHTLAGIAQMPQEMIDQGMPGGWNTCVRVDDVDATAASAAELGGTVVMPPMDVPGPSGPARTALIQDPNGANLFLWTPQNPDETVEYLIPGGLSWNELNTPDPEGAAAFYASLLGWNIEEITEGTGPYRQVRVDGEGEGGIRPMPENASADEPAYWLVYFGTDDVEATVAKAVELGGTVQVGPAEEPGVVVLAVLADPVGARFGVLRGLMEG